MLAPLQQTRERAPSERSGWRAPALGVAHGGAPNDGADRRIGFNVTYIRPSVRSVRPGGAFAQLVRGVDTHGHMQHDLHPTGPETAEEKLSAFKAKSSGLSRTIMNGADLEKFSAVTKERASLNVAPGVTPGGPGGALVDDRDLQEEKAKL